MDGPGGQRTRGPEKRTDGDSGSRSADTPAVQRRFGTGASAARENYVITAAPEYRGLCHHGAPAHNMVDPGGGD